VGAFPTLDGALPVIGHLAEMYRRFPTMCARGARAHGPLFYIHGGPGPKQLMCTDPSAITILKSPSGSNSFYTEGFSALLGNTLLAFDGEQHRRVRQVLNPPFSPQRVRRSDVLQIVSDAAQTRIDRWCRGGEIDIVAETREMALQVIFRMVGVPVERLTEWRKQYDRFLLAGLPSTGRFRGPIYWYAQRARRWIDEQMAIMVERLRAAEETSTLVGAVANARDEDGVLLELDLVISNLRLLVFAGHETTASAMAWTALHLASSRPFQERAMAEVDGVSDLAELAMQPERMTFAEALFRESLRLYPAVHSVVRRATVPIELEIGTIPKDTLLNLPLVHLLRDPQRFPEPDCFVPDRWKERPRPGTIETAMFGGGPHFCLGYHIAIAEGTLFTLLLARAMRKGRLRLRPREEGPVPRPRFLPLIHPPRGSMLRLVPDSP
jgi:cytochrome P450